METDTSAERTGQASSEQKSTPPPGTASGPVLIARNLDSFNAPPTDDPNELIKSRMLCRGAILLVAGPTGIGKSSLGLQSGILWALGKPCFGMTPTRPLRSLYIQAENDDGDIYEFREGIFKGLKLSDAERKMACENIVIHLEDKRRSKDFLEHTLEPLLEHHRSDLANVDPALAYLGADAKEQEEVGRFLRAGVVPIIRGLGAAAVISHHTNKPLPQMGKAKWAPTDFAYLGSGSIEWANTARAVITLRPIGETGHLFELRAPKRGIRLGWKDSEGAPTTVRYIAHSEDCICWREATDAEINKAKQSRAEDQQRAFELLQGEPDGLNSERWYEECKREYGWARNRFFRIKSDLIDLGRVIKETSLKTWKAL